MKKDLCSEDQLSLLRQEHRALDKRIRKMQLRPSMFDQLRINKLKRQKLRLKEQIEHLQ